VRVDDTWSCRGAVRLVATGHVVFDERVAEALLSANPPRRGRSRRRRVAERLGIGVDMVRRHLAMICANLGVVDRDAAVALASRRRYLLGRGRGFSAIWDVTQPGGPVERFDETARARAGMRCEALRAQRGRWTWAACSRGDTRRALSAPPFRPPRSAASGSSSPGPATLDP
jgi:hypothetical protein